MALIGKKTKFVAKLRLTKRPENKLLATIMIDENIGFVSGDSNNVHPKVLEALQSNVIKDALFVGGRDAKSPTITCYLSDEPQVIVTEKGDRLDLAVISIDGFVL